jgi:ribosomal protein S6--L-glutamate ligase
MRVAVGGIPGAWSSEQLAASLRAEGTESCVLSPGDIVHDLGAGSVTWNGEDLRRLDGLAVKKLGDQSRAASRLRLHALRALERQGVRVFSPADVIDVAMDRYRMTMQLAEAGLPVPATIAAATEGGLLDAVTRLGDCVVKPVYTSKGRGMVRVHRGDDDAALRALDGDHLPYLAQQFIQSPGRDIGATVVGGTFIGAFYRVAQAGEWMTTTDAGGRYAPCDLSAKGIQYAERASRAFGLDYTVVDLVEQGDDFLLYEVSAFGGFRGLKEASNHDSAADYARHIVRTLEARR